MHGSHASMSSSAANNGTTNGAVANGAGSPRGKTRAEGLNGFANGNGTSYTNGTSRQSPQFRGHNRQEMVRLLMQTMQDLGYVSAAQALENESGVELESPSVAALRASVENGEWEEAEQLLLGSEEFDAGRHIMPGHDQGLALKPGTEKHVLRFMIREQKYLELLEQRDHGRALIVLRTELNPLAHDRNHLHFLSGLVVCSSVEDLKAQAHWLGARGGSRHQLLQALSEHIHHSVMIPPSRLAGLLDQVKRHWVEKCVWHNPIEPFSLFVDHACDREAFPLTTVRVLPQLDEVHYLEFSHDGRYLATAGRDKTAIVYNVDNDWEEKFRLEGHTNSVGHVTWSPDDQWLVTCSQDQTAKLWNCLGDCVMTIHQYTHAVTAAAWLPDSSGFIAGSLDIEFPLCKWLVTDLTREKAKPAHEFRPGFRTQDIAVTPDGQRAIAMSADPDCPKIVIYNLYTYEQEYSINFRAPLTCVRASKDGRHLLLNLADNEMQCLDLDSREIVQRYVGQQQGKYVIRSTWAGADENLVLSGSQDGKVYVFHRERGTLIETLDGHRMTETQADGGRSWCVNAVAWNSASQCMFASAGDDKTVRIWSKGTYTPATTRRTSSDMSLLNASHTSLPGVESTRGPVGSEQWRIASDLAITNRRSE